MPRRAAPDAEPVRVVEMIWKGKHSDILLDATRERDVEGALRSGKTTVCLWAELNALLDQPGCHTILSRWTDDATDAWLKPVWRAICALAGVVVKWNAKETFDLLANGSRAYIRGLKPSDQVSRYAKFRGPTLGRAYVDQAEELPQDVYEELNARLTQKGVRQQMTISPNPVEETHWIAKRFPERGIDPHRRLFQVSLYDNAHNLTPEIIAAAERNFPPEHPKHRTMILGQRGLNVIGDPVYKGMFKRTIHLAPVDYNPYLPLDEAFDFGKHHPCWVARQTDALGGVRVLAGILGEDLFLEDFLPVVRHWRAEWFGDDIETRTCCDPAGSAANSQGTRKRAVDELRAQGFAPQWKDNANSPAVRLAMIEHYGGLMRKRTSAGEAFQVSSAADRFIRVTATGQVLPWPFIADGLEVGYVWDEHLVSVGNKQMRKPKKDGWFEHGQNCLEYLEVSFGSGRPPEKKRRQSLPRIVQPRGDMGWAG